MCSTVRIGSFFFFFTIEFLNKRKDIDMEKEMLVLGKFKSGEGKMEKFMGWMQSDEGMAERKKIADVTKTVAAVTPDKSAVMFKISVHNEEALRKFVTGQNPVGKPIYDECVESIQVWELSPVKI